MGWTPKYPFSNTCTGKIFSFLQKLQNGIWAFQPSYSLNIWGILSGLQRSNCKANHLPQSSTKVMNEKYSGSISSFSFILFTGTIFSFNYLKKKFKYMQKLNFVHFPCNCVHMWNLNTKVLYNAFYFFVFRHVLVLTVGHLQLPEFGRQLRS
jgi:hypothetical protein